MTPSVATLNQLERLSIVFFVCSEPNNDPFGFFVDFAHESHLFTFLGGIGLINA